MVLSMALSAAASRQTLPPPNPPEVSVSAIDSLRNTANSAIDNPEKADRRARRMQRAQRRRIAPTAYDSTLKPLSTADTSSLLSSANVGASLIDTAAIASLDRRRVNQDTTATKKPTGPRIMRVKTDLDNIVDIVAKDSLVLIGQNNAYVYGDGNITYGEIKLNADNIEMDLAQSTVYAVGTTDSIGEVKGAPIFNDRGTEYRSETMRYNFKSEKGFITNVLTEQGEGFLQGGTSKKVGDNIFYVQDGFYTTCDNHDAPHFGFRLTKAKVRPKKDIVTGPAYMVLEGLPLPLAVPFGYFPFSEKYSSGVIFPSFGDDYNRGFYLSNGGYYFAIIEATATIKTLITFFIFIFH